MMPDNGFYNNTAGLNGLKNQAVSFMFHNEGEGMYNLDLAYARRMLSRRYILGTHLNYKTSRSYDILDSSGNKDGSFNYNYIRADLLCASSFYFIDSLNELNYGVRLKMENEKADQYTDTGFQADIGLQYAFTFFKSKYIDSFQLSTVVENLGKGLGGVDRMRFAGGISSFIPLVKNIRQMLFAVSHVQYFNSLLKENNGQVFSIGYKEDLSTFTSALKDYALMISVSYNYIRAIRILGDFSGLEYGINIDSRYFNFGYSCLFNSLSGNNYYTSLSIKF